MKQQNMLTKPVTDYDLRLLRIYRAVVENGGFSAAETELGVTRSTISVHMSNLESRMQLKLCVRGRAGFALTEAGQAVYHASSVLFEAHSDFSYLVSSLTKELSGELVIQCSDQLDRHKQMLLAEVIKIINQRAPNLTLVIDNNSIHEIERLLLKDKAHIGLFPCYQQIEGLSYQMIFSEPIFLCCGSEHPLYNLNDNDITDEMLSITSVIHPGIDIDTKGTERLTKMNVTAKAYQFDIRKALVLSGEYLGYFPISYIQAEIEGQEIRLVQPKRMSYQFELSMVSKTSPRESVKVDLLNEVFNQVFSQ